MTVNITVGIGGYLGHDGNAAIMIDGELIASIQEERLSRIKHDSSFPALAIAECIKLAGVSNGQVTDVVFAEKPVQSKLYDYTQCNSNKLTQLLGRIIPENSRCHYVHKARKLFPKAKFHYAWHHLSHVAGAFHTSKYDKSAFLCIDGKGEDYSASIGVVTDKSIEIIREQPYENGLGLFYTLITYYLGFLSFGSEYKVMGLAPYGSPIYVGKLSELFNSNNDGGFQLKFKANFKWEGMMQLLPKVSKVLGVPIRGPKDPITQEHANIANSLQTIFENEVLKMARFAKNETNQDALLFCGGCAQNCVAAGKIRESRIFKSIFNSPVGGDMGSALGAVALFERTRKKRAFKLNVRGFYLGTLPGPVPESASKFKINYNNDLHHFVASQIANGKIVAWVRGPMELGARALGARSIFADPRQPGMQSKLNLAVKFRESFRPFAPAILAEKIGEWFDSSEESDYMNYTAKLLPHLRNEVSEPFDTLKQRLNFERCSISSVVHVDFSARIQTVRKEIHPDFYKLLNCFYEITGVPILINTSFNVSGQPIVNTGKEAWECFVNTDIDLLVVEDSIFGNPFEKTKEEKLEWLRQFANYS